MKSLTQKIIDRLLELANEQDNPIIKSLFQSAAKEVIDIEQNCEFEEAARVVIKHLSIQVEKYHPHHTVIITSTSCELVEGIKMSNQVFDYLQD